ncbi:hypothetical protein EON65_33090 [archaeon]|nr:MAG: hypothetical protein EON65_33090 [archaeon]
MFSIVSFNPGSDLYLAPRAHVHVTSVLEQHAHPQQYLLAIHREVDASLKQLSSYQATRSDYYMHAMNIPPSIASPTL